MGCELAVRHEGGYMSVKFVVGTNPADLRFGFADVAKLSRSEVDIDGSIFHEEEYSGDLTDQEFIGHYYKLAILRGIVEGANYVVVEKGLEKRIVRSGKNRKLSSVLTLLVRR